MTTIEELDSSAGRVAQAIEDLMALSGPAGDHLQRRSLEIEARRVRDSVVEAAAGQMRIAIVGEFKSGKSALVNALVGEAIVGVDPVHSTSVVTEVRFADESALHAEVMGHDGNEFVELTPRSVRRLSTESEPMVDGRSVLSLRVASPSQFLSAGLRLVDTPSVSGGLSSPVASIVLGELLQSHAWILATDASQELTAPECELLSVGASLCPVVIVVATKHDASTHASRIMEKNRALLDDLDLPNAPAVIPTSANLLAASVRLADAVLERESGIPLLRWYISRATMSAARLSAARNAASEIATSMDLLDGMIGDEIGVLTTTGEHAELVSRAELQRNRCEDLISSINPSIKRITNEFTRRTQRDLEDRIAAVLRESLDDLDELDQVKQWPKLDRRVQADVNRVLAEHLAEIRKELGRVIDQMAQTLELSPDDLRIIDRVVVHDDHPIELSGQLAQPSARSGPTRAQQMIMPARVGVVGAGGVGLIASAQVIALTVASAALLPVAVAGSAWWVRRRYKEAESATWKQEARVELTRFIDESRRLINRCSEDIRDEVLADLPDLVKQDLSRIAQQMAGEVDRLQRLAGDRANVHRDEVDNLEAWRSEVRVLSTHARRTVHRLHVPQIIDLTSLDGRPADGGSTGAPTAI